MKSPSPPVVVFAFANDDDDHLALLKRESSQVNETFSPLHDKGALELYREESATVNEISSIFQRFDRRIMLFHYGGHAGGHGLRLEEGDAQAGGLAQFFEQQKENLMLVFLNGCSTLPQVSRLMDLGIKAVIATSTPIEDPKAVEFAREFYRGLSVRQPIGRAFESASAMLCTKYEGVAAPGVVEYRGIEIGLDTPPPSQEPEAIPWGLYINKDHKEEILDWRLPIKPRRLEMQHQGSDYQPNQFLKYVLEAMLFLDEDLRDKLTNEEGLLVDSSGNPLNDQQKFYIILKHLPWPIGAQFQKLIALRTLNVDRLRQIASTYLVTSQTLLSLIIAQFFGKTAKGQVKDWTLLREIIDMDRETFRTFDFLGHIKKLQFNDFFNGNTPPFVEEIVPFLSELQNEKSDLYKAYLELEELRDSIQEERMDWEQAVDFYEDAEASLTILLSRVAFLVKYKLLAVRDIQIVNYRHADIKYLHRLGELNGVGDTLGLSARELNRFSHCDSILLVRDIDDLEDEKLSEEIINLTPLLIDENAFLKYPTDVINIYMYAFREGDTFFYYKVNNNIFNILEKEDSFLAINKRRDEDEDKLFMRFLPVEQSAFMKGTDPAAINANPLQSSKDTNPYAKIVEQMETVLEKFSG